MSPRSIRQTLQSLPKTLDQTYERIILGIEEEYKKQAIIALRWLVFARRPLKLIELAEAVAVDSMKADCHVFNPEERLFKPEFILEICSSLVSASGSESLAEVRLAHFSVQEYIVSDRILGGPAADFNIDHLRADSILGEFCTSYLLKICPQPIPTDPSFRDLSSYIARYQHISPLLPYAVEYWYKHASSSIVRSSCTSELILTFLARDKQDRYIKNWWNLASYFHLFVFFHLQDFGNIQGAIGYAAYLGLLPEVVIMLEKEIASEERARLLEASLYAAALGRHFDIVKMLLDVGAPPDAQGRQFKTALQAAAQNRQPSIVHALLEKGAKPNITGGEYGCALYAAASVGCLVSVKHLLAGGADINFKASGPKRASSAGDTLLGEAVYNGRLDIVELLLQHGADPNSEGVKYGSVLQMATLLHSNGLFTLLLSNDANPNLKSSAYQSAYESTLQTAAEWCKTEAARLDLIESVDPNISGGDESRGTSLQATTELEEPSIVQLLLQHGANPNLAAGRFGSPLEIATYQKDKPIIGILLANGAKLDTYDQELHDAVKAAAARSMQEAVDLLLDHFAIQNQKSKRVMSLYNWRFREFSRNPNHRLRSL